MKRWRRVILVAVVALVVLPLLGFLVWAELPQGAMMEAISDLGSDAEVQVTNTDLGYMFTPAGQQPTTGLIFYPGGHVDYRAYARPLNALAAQGYATFLVPMPLSLAVLKPDAADAVIAAHPEITHWTIAGHSLGGVMAADYAYKHPETIRGLALWAAYPQDSESLADRSDLAVAAIFGSNDGLVSAEDRQKAVNLLPASAAIVVIEGGNHRQFGSYGEQGGDNPASIERTDQQAQVVAATQAMLQQAEQEAP